MGFATVDNFLIENGLMSNWSGRATAAERILWLRRAMEVPGGRYRFGYDRNLCSMLSDPFQADLARFHGFAWRREGRS